MHGWDGTGATDNIPSTPAMGSAAVCYTENITVAGVTARATIKHEAAQRTDAGKVSPTRDSHEHRAQPLQAPAHVRLCAAPGGSELRTRMDAVCWTYGRALSQPSEQMLDLTRGRVVRSRWAVMTMWHTLSSTASTSSSGVATDTVVVSFRHPALPVPSDAIVLARCSL